MKILIVSERYWPEVGAAPSRLANMAQGLKEKGCDVEVLTGLPNYPKGKIFEGYRGRLCKKEEHQGIKLFRYWIYATVSRHPIVRVLNMFSFAVMIWLFAFRIGRIRSYDRVIIQTPTLVVAASAMVIFKKIYGKNCVLNVSDIWPLTAVDMGAMTKGSRSFKFMSMLERFLYRNSDSILGQSQEILDHIKNFSHKGRLFLYRNLQQYDITETHQRSDTKFKVMFCGMLGVAQDVAGIVKNVPFKELGVEFHVIGGGKQYEEISDYVKSHSDSNVFAYGFVPKEEITSYVLKMDSSIVPLATRIRGAVPSKIYDILPHGVPIIFSGGGEGADFIHSRNLGAVVAPKDYKGLAKAIKQLKDLSTEEYRQLSQRCLDVSRKELNFALQMDNLMEFLE